MIEQAVLHITPVVHSPKIGGLTMDGDFRLVRARYYMPAACGHETYTYSIRAVPAGAINDPRCLQFTLMDMDNALLSFTHQHPLPFMNQGVDPHTTPCMACQGIERDGDPDLQDAYPWREWTPSVEYQISQGRMDAVMSLN